MNHFVCCDISNNTYADKFGFTDHEIDRILSDTGFLEKKHKLKEWYDGYCFGNIAGIYCPLDIMQYMHTLQKDPTAEPELFWKNTSGNDIIQLAIQQIENTSREKIEILLFGKSIQEKLESQLTYNSITENESTIWSLLYTSGYLTRSDTKYQRKFTTIMIPNKEVKEIFTTDIQR